MQKIIVPISKCIPGMITAAPVIDLKTGITIMAANQELTSNNIKNIINFVHTDIWVYLNSFEKVWKLSAETIKNYKKYSNTLMSLVGTLNSNELIEIEDFEIFCHNLSLDFKENYSLLGCTNLIEQLDYNTYNHSLNVAFISILICRWCGFDERFTACSIKAGLLHDIGILNLPFNPFDTKKPWSDEQILEYEKHPIYSFNITKKFVDLDPIIPKAILVHHECCDGSGFPVHVSSPHITLLGKVLSLADRYELLRHETHIFNVLKMLLVDYLTQFDPKLLLTFCSYLATYYIGTFAVLSNGQIGEVIFINPNCLYRPIIKINETFLNLYENPSIEIISIK